MNWPMHTSESRSHSGTDLPGEISMVRDRWTGAVWVLALMALLLPRVRIRLVVSFAPQWS